MTTIHLQVEGEEIILLDVRSGRPNALAVLDAAAALELAARLKSAATSIQQQAVKEALLARAPVTMWAQGTCRRCGKDLRGDGATTAEAHESLARAIAAHLCPVAPCGCRVNPGWRCQSHGAP